MKKNRRRAVHAELVRESKDNPGYFRYNITIREKDGMEHVGGLGLCGVTLSLTSLTSAYLNKK